MEFSRVEIDIDIMTLNIRYDDAFVAYINGIEVARRNFTGTPVWDSNANNDSHEAGSVSWDENIDIASYACRLPIYEAISVL